MASTIYCDNTDAHTSDAPVQATTLITDLNEGSVMAFCGPDFVAFCVIMARQAEAQRPEAAATPTDDTGDDTDEDTDEDAVKRLEGANPATPNPTESGGSSDAVPPGGGDDGSPKSERKRGGKSSNPPDSKVAALN